MSQPFRVLKLDSRVGDIAVFRLTAAGICLLAIVWLALSSPPWWALFAIPLGLFVVVFWVRRYAKARLVVEEGRGHVDLRGEGFQLVADGATELYPWDRVVAVEADEDRVAIRIELHDDADPVFVEPIYGGLGLYELEEAFRAAREASPSYGE